MVATSEAIFQIWKYSFSCEGNQAPLWGCVVPCRHSANAPTFTPAQLRVLTGLV